MFISKSYLCNSNHKGVTFNLSIVENDLKKRPTMSWFFIKWTNKVVKSIF